MKFNLMNGRYNEKRLTQALTGIVFLYQALAVLAVVWALVLASSWLREPFLGSFYEHTLVFTDTGSLTGAWEFNSQVASGDQLKAVNGVEVNNSRDVRDVIVGNFVPGESVTLTIDFADGTTRDQVITLQQFPDDGVSVYVILPTLISFIFLALSIWTFGLRRNEPAGRAFTMFASSFSIVTGTIFNLWTSHELSLIWTFACAMAGGSTIALAVSFPSAPRILVERPYLRWIGFLVSFVLTGLAAPYIFNMEAPTEYIGFWRNIYYFDALAILFLLATNFYYAVYSPSPVSKSQARSTLFGALIAFVPLTIFLSLGQVLNINFSPLMFLPVVIFRL